MEATFIATGTGVSLCKSRVYGGPLLELNAGSVHIANLLKPECKAVY